jgi:hypothetical protein
MSIELSVSSPKCGDREKEDQVMAALATKGIDACVQKTTSTVEYGGTHLIEPGFRISLYNFKAKTFGDEVWPWLQTLLDLECAHVRCDSYVGCVLNWPGVLAESKCKTKI